LLLVSLIKAIIRFRARIFNADWSIPFFQLRDQFAQSTLIIINSRSHLFALTRRNPRHCNWHVFSIIYPIFCWCSDTPKSIMYFICIRYMYSICIIGTSQVPPAKLMTIFDTCNFSLSTIPFTTSIEDYIRKTKSTTSK